MKTLTACWNHIGIRGDGSCAELARAVHCRNCPTYSASATEILDQEVDARYLAEWSEHFRSAKPDTARQTESVVIFRLGTDWLALPSSAFQEVCDLRAIHSLPHRRNGVVLGVVNVRGSLVVCVSLHRLLGVDGAAAALPATERRLVHGRLLVAGRDGERVVFPVDEVHGIHRFHPDQLGEAPASIAKSTTTFSRAILPWQGKSVGVLDGQLVFESLNKSLA